VGQTSGEPIIGATVTVSGESTQTDAAGAFMLTGVDKGTASGSVVASGFAQVSFGLDFGKGDASATVEVADAEVVISIKELAIEPQEVTSATVSIDGQSVALGQPARTLAPGTRTITVSSPGHEAYSAQVLVVAGQNSIVATLSLTPQETYKRMWAAMQFHRDSVSYKYIHPDERKKLSLKKWKIWMSGTEILSVKWGAVRMLAKWKSPVTKKTYQNVAEVDRIEKYQVTGSQYSDFGHTYTSNYSQHFVKLNGLWYMLHMAI
jgi:hypothetical protein